MVIVPLPQKKAAAGAWLEGRRCSSWDQATAMEDEPLYCAMPTASLQAELCNMLIDWMERSAAIDVVHLEQARPAKSVTWRAFLYSRGGTRTLDPGIMSAVL